MDPGHFLTNSGSKIPMPKSKKENIIPSRPKLAPSAVTTTNYLGEKANNYSENKESVPNIAKSSVGITRCKTGVSLKNTSCAVKRTAAGGEGSEGPASKQPKAVPKTGFPYKAKSWELKLRISECEEWVVDLRNKCSEYEIQYNDVMEKFEEEKHNNSVLESEKSLLVSELQEIKKQKLTIENDLNYDKLFHDSKEFVEKIDKLENLIVQKDREVSSLKTDLTNLREDLLTKTSKLSELQCKVEDLEFKTKRQKNQIEDLDNTLTRNRQEINDLRQLIREKDDLIANLQNKVDISEREIKYKTSNLDTVNDELLKARNKIFELEKEISSNKLQNSLLEDKVNRISTELTEKTANGISLSETCDELKKKLCENEKLRRQLHNTVQDLKGNIRVFCRVRPPIPAERDNSIPLCTINFPDEGSLEISKSDPFTNSTTSVVSRPKFVKHEFSFDKVFNPGSSQEDIFVELSQLVQSALDGYNVCVFAYGQTGSGKTYTMEGENEDLKRGMIPRTVDHIFKSLKELELIGWKYTVEVSFLEIYNEIIRDLLRNDKEGSSLKIMQIDGKTNEITIPGLTIMEVNSYEDLDRLYILAHQNRAVAYTSCNERSSRSHSVTRIKVTGTHQNKGEKCYGSLYLVDLAGSERLNEPMSDPRFREMKNINKSLSELGNVILGLLQKQEHIPYRNSKLTHLLQPALGGSSKTLMLVNISPAESCLQETLCSLRFAEKVNKVKIGTTKKRIAYENSNIAK
ncbi:protein claret segregational, putative [Pediculus humanus corporis]|uniref:Kinesin-like protein n=1 Tax=Pediculus humanus subsp. corporis TaxID=121224 RepID=E0VE11_PEDHC|nr:protein claret segregational, putative [Pediculus humanus corporis]EEB11617.1 protein claret segregational, putative [Pediculus humanus corporis]